MRSAKNLGVERYITDDPYEFVKNARYGISMNLDGIWGGNMFAGGSGSILPNKITSKHSFRYVPNVTYQEIVSKLRKHLDKRGYQDVEINVIGDTPWSKGATDTEIGRALAKTFDAFNVAHGELTKEPVAHELDVVASLGDIGVSLVGVGGREELRDLLARLRDGPLCRALIRGLPNRGNISQGEPGCHDAGN